MSDSPARHLDLAGASNFRDLGGYPEGTAVCLRWRQIFRSNHLGASDRAADVEVLRRLGLKSAFDFRGVRGAREARVRGGGDRGPFAADRADRGRGTAAHACEGRSAVVGGRAGRDARLLPQLCALNTPSFRALFAHLLEDRAPLVIHCTAGKDRTGFACALILHALGVPDDVICGGLSADQPLLSPRPLRLQRPAR